MNSKTAREILGVIRVENQHRADQLDDQDPDAAHDRWLFTDEPFINEMCLMVLAAVHHQVERELVFLAARANRGETITREQYRLNVQQQRELVRQRGGVENLITTLNLSSAAAWEAMKALRLLANCVKHEPTQQPDERLLNHIGLPLKPEGNGVVGYLPLPESYCFREGLAEYLNLSKDADYCTIAERFVNLAEEFLNDVGQRNESARLTGKVSLSEYYC